jgi:hypothetical protein
MATTCRIILRELISTLKNACGPEDPTSVAVDAVTVTDCDPSTQHGDFRHIRVPRATVALVPEVLGPFSVYCDELVLFKFGRGAQTLT